MGLWFLLLPVAEWWLGLRLSAWLGAGVLLLWLLADVLIGLALIRQQGRALMRQLSGWQSGLLAPSLSAGMMDGLGRALAGLLFIFPGVLSDGLALLLLLPPLRRRLLARLQSRLRAGAWSPFQPHGPGSASAGSGDVFEGEAREVREPAPPLPRGEGTSEPPSCP